VASLPRLNVFVGCFVEELLDRLLDWFALPKNGLVTVFIVAFISATLLPMGSEPAVFGYAKLNPDQFWIVILVATAGNTLGGAVDWWLGYGAKQALAKDKQTRYLRWFERLGPKALFFSFLPVVGDPLCTVAGWLRLNFWQSVAWMALGKFTRYVLMTAALLWVPDDWWRKLLAPFTGG
jgi:membrane protein YqaA with SNARE-associated domain